MITSVTTVVAVAAALVMETVDHKDFSSVGSGFWWAVQTVTRVGYGDLVPETVAGRLLASLVMLLGLGFLTVVTASITSAFIERSRQPLYGQTEKEQMRTVNERLERIEAALTPRP